MLPKLDKLTQRIQELQKFTTIRVNQDANYSLINQELVKLADSVKTARLTMKICGRFAIQAPALEKLLNTNKKLTEICQLQTLTLPGVSEAFTQTPPRLILNYASAPGQKVPCHLLASTQKLLIGRRSSCDIVIPEQYVKVSGHHAEIMRAKFSSITEPASSWQICDLNTTNGTYVNGVKLQGACKVLEPGDKITLAYPEASSKSPELIFEDEVNNATNKENEIDKLIKDGDIFCLVINATQAISPEEQEFIQKMGNRQTEKLFIIIDVSAKDTPIDNTLQKNLAETQSWIQRQSFANPPEVVSLILRPFYPTNSQYPEIASSSDSENDSFCKSVENAILNWFDSTFTENINKQLLSYISRIEESLTLQIQTIEQAQYEDEIENLNKALKKAKKQKDRFWENLEEDINCNITRFADTKRNRSIYNRLQQFIYTLEFKLTTQEDQDRVIIQLESQNTSDLGRSLNEKIVNFCYQEVGKWSTEEWRRICNEYADGGLNHIIDSTYNTLNLIPSRNLDKSLFQLPQKVDLERGLRDTFIEFSNDASFTQIASEDNVIALIGTSAVSFIEGRYVQFASELFSFVKQKVTQTIEYQSKLEECKTELINDLCEHYQPIAIDLVDKIMQNINRALKAEKQRLDDAIEQVEDEYKSYATTLKKRAGEQKNKQRELELDKTELEKIRYIHV